MARLLTFIGRNQRTKHKKMVSRGVNKVARKYKY